MPRLIDPGLLDALEGLSERHQGVSRRIDALLDEAALYDRLIDREELERLEGLRRELRRQARDLMSGALERLERG